MNMETGRLVHRLAGHEFAVESVAYNQKGDILVSGDQSGFNIMWNTETNEQIRTLDKHGWVIKDIVFSPNDEILATGDWGFGRTLRLWNSETGDLVWSAEAGKVDDISFSYDGSVIAAGVLDTGLVNIWDTESGQLLQTLKTGIENVLAVSFIGIDRKLVCGGENGLQVWDGETGEKLQDFPEQGLDSPVRTVDINPDRRLLAVGREDGKVQLWDMESIELLETLDFHANRMHTAVFSLDGKTLATAANEWEIGIWDIEPFSIPTTSVNPKDKMSVVWGGLKNR